MLKNEKTLAQVEAVTDWWLAAKRSGPDGFSEPEPNDMTRAEARMWLAFMHGREKAGALSQNTECAKALDLAMAALSGGEGR